MSSRTLFSATAALAVVATLAILVLTANSPDRALGQQVTPTPTATATAAATPTGTPTSVLVTATNGTGATPGGPTATPTATPTPGPGGHDARLTSVSGVPKNVRLLPGEVVADSASIVVANQSTHSDTIGVYVDVMAPASGGCAPNGRVLQTTVTLAAGAKTTPSVPVSYSCADPPAPHSPSYTRVVVADHRREHPAPSRA